MTTLCRLCDDLLRLPIAFVSTMSTYIIVLKKIIIISNKTFFSAPPLKGRHGRHFRNASTYVDLMSTFKGRHGIAKGRHYINEGTV